MAACLEKAICTVNHYFSLLIYVYDLFSLIGLHIWFERVQFFLEILPSPSFQSTSGGHGLQDDSTAQQKVEATYENEASNHSSGNLAGVLTNKEFFEKESEDQVSVLLLVNFS